MQQLSTDTSKAPRFLHLHIQEDLLEGWSLLKETGYQGGAGRVTRTHFPNYAEAIESMLKERDRQTQRGYRVVFVEGQGHMP